LCAADPKAHDWTVEEVKTWALSLDSSFAPELAQRLEKLRVDGTILLYIDETDVAKDLGFKGAEAAKILAAIQTLRESYGGWREPQMPNRTFMQYRAMNRNLMDSILPALFCGAPRYALKLLDEFPPEAKPTHEESWLVWAVCPQYYILAYAADILGGIPWTLRISTFFSLLMQLHALYKTGRGMVLSAITGQIGSSILIFLSDVIRGVLNVIGAEIGTSLVIFFNRNLFHPLTPWFISDFWFYMFLYTSPFISLGLLFFKVTLDSFSLGFPGEQPSSEAAAESARDSPANSSTEAADTKRQRERSAERDQEQGTTASTPQPNLDSTNTEPDSKRIKTE
jgi:hypothetical protein